MSTAKNNKNSRLGRGLESLIPKSFLGGGKTILNVRVSDVMPSPLQPRKVFDTTELETLAASIKANGIIQPLVVRRNGDKYELIAGERRYRASQLAQIDMVPVVIRDVSDQEVLKLALIENLHRHDLNALEVAQGYEKLIEEFGLTHQDLGKVFNKSRSAISNTLRLLNLSAAVKQALMDGKITEGHARTIVSHSDETKQNELLSQILRGGLNVRETEAALKVDKPIASKPSQPLAPVLEQLKLNLEGELNMPVAIKPKKKGGTITIKYANEADLQRIKLALVEIGA